MREYQEVLNQLAEVAAKDQDVEKALKEHIAHLEQQVRGV